MIREPVAGTTHDMEAIINGSCARAPGMFRLARAASSICQSLDTVLNTSAATGTSKENFQRDTMMWRTALAEGVVGFGTPLTREEAR